jgi:Tol biopolymer transport system component
MGAAVAVAVAASVSLPAAARANYSTARFKETTNAYAYGQAPVFMPNGRQVVFGKDFQAGQNNQIYIAGYPSGSGLKCLTCTGPDTSVSNINGVPQVRAQGDWILFSSWRGRYITFGSPGYGGIGSALWVMHPDGSDQTQLTETTCELVTCNTNNPGSFGADEGWDDYHAYWSPNGNMVEWAHFDGNLPTGGVGKWDVELANFAVKNGVPSLTDIRVVRPANGHWYETQWWAPDGSGFLYTETTGSAATPHLFFCRLIDNDNACQVRQLTSDPSWDEQALFTPDMKDVIFMSSRNQPGLFNTWAQTAQTLGLPNDYDWLLIAPLFEAGYLQPVGQEYTDLYELDLATGSVRRLTYDGENGWVTPEFTWDPKGKFLMWTESRLPNGYRYPFPPSPSEYAQALEQLAGSPYVPSTDLSPGGVGVAPLPLQQRTQIGVFQTGGSKTKAGHKKHKKRRRPPKKNHSRKAR